MFQKGFLLTTSECASLIGYGIKEEKQRATAVFANSMFKNEQRINIYKIGYFFNYIQCEIDIGVALVG